MTKTRKRIISLLVAISIYALLNLIAVMFGETDYRRIKAGELPRFAVKEGLLEDGGTIFFDGFGYDLWKMHQLYSEDGERVGFIKGPRIFYSFWVLIGRDHDDTHTVRVDHRKPQQADDAPDGPNP